VTGDINSDLVHHRNSFGENGRWIGASGIDLELITGLVPQQTLSHLRSGWVARAND
jgi:hypothetical protein